MPKYIKPPYSERSEESLPVFSNEAVVKTLRDSSLRSE
jgi:hypothetical protein